MATLTTEQIQYIIKNNPNKSLVANARQYSKKLQLHVLGKNLSDSMVQNVYFENPDIYQCRKDGATSNMDLFARLLHREEQVFTAKGGSSMYKGLSEAQTMQFDAKLDRIRYNMTIRRWIKEFALQAYRVDPMGVLFVEVDADGNSYPTYKSTDCVYDYKTTGRKIEYLVLRLRPAEAKQFLADAQLDITDPALSITTQDYSPVYFRVVDDEKDAIWKVTEGMAQELHNLPMPFDELPAIIASDIIDFTNPINFLSPLDKTIELADSYLQDRSIRDLSKKYSGFPKGYEPLLSCATCAGTGLLAGKPCPDCTIAGQTEKGTGYKLRTKVADIARFPMPQQGETAYDPSKFYGYITPSIQTWDKQDTSLNDIEAAINDTYWGTTNRQSTTGPTTTDKHAFQETATKTLADLQPIYARLNQTADWAQATENAICNFIGENMFANFELSMRTYGRYYILETPDELIEQYLDQKTKSAPQSTLFDTLRKYYHSLYANEPMQLAIKLKLVNVEPFVHKTVVEVQAANPSRLDFYKKMYYADWLATKDDNYLLATQPDALINDLTAYAQAKMVEPADLLTPPALSVAFAERKIA